MGNADEDKEGCFLNDQPDTKGSKADPAGKSSLLQGENAHAPHKCQEEGKTESRQSDC